MLKTEKNNVYEICSDWDKWPDIINQLTIEFDIKSIKEIELNENTLLNYKDLKITWKPDGIRYIIFFCELEKKIPIFIPYDELYEVLVEKKKVINNAITLNITWNSILWEKDSIIEAFFLKNKMTITDVFRISGQELHSLPLKMRRSCANLNSLYQKSSTEIKIIWATYMNTKKIKSTPEISNKAWLLPQKSVGIRWVLEINPDDTRKGDNCFIKKFKKSDIPESYLLDKPNILKNGEIQNYLYIPNISSSIMMNKKTNFDNYVEIKCIYDSKGRIIPEESF